MAESAPVAAVRGAPDAAAAGDSTPRKRRRRAPTTGAAVDCFACQETQTTCDRRRPYCSQCIDRGKTCSGYKTQLTWGVGVASRGKLRGLSLPVTSKPSAPSGETTKAATPKASSPSMPTSFSDSFPFPSESQISPGFAVPPSPSTYTPNPSIYQFGTSPQSEDPSNPNAPPQHQFTWHVPTNTQPQPPTRPPYPKKVPRRHSIQPIQMPPPPVSAMLSPMPMSAGVFGGYPFGSLDSAVTDPVAAPFPQYPETSGVDKRNSIPASWSSGGHLDGYRSGFSSSSWRSDTMSSDFSSNRSSRALTEEEIFTPDLTAIDSLDSFSTERGQPSRVSYGFPYQEFTLSEEVEEDVDSVVAGQNVMDPTQPNLSLVPSGTLDGPLIGKTPKLRELIHYYDQVIAPVILAFDGPTNPYRTHILRLAHNSDALQHAIAALAASNLRMRRENEPGNPATQKYLTDGSGETRHDISVRNSSLAHNLLRNQVDQPEEVTQPGKNAQRELYHKGQSIKALNAELSQLRLNPSASDETVLATLFLLCLYHVCDTGVAKFRTQFAGVKKIMALRNRRPKSSDANWIITMFRWFDAMTATVNNREGQFDEDFADDGLDEWALENLAGCDARLFKTMSKLGRLNLLSQGQAVNEGSSTPRAQPPRPNQHGLNSLETSPVTSGPSESVPLSTNEPLETMGPQFCTEWYALQQELLNWHFDPTTIPASMRSSATTIPDYDPEIIDLRHISESFRYSALLYLERVAHPTQSSCSPTFQALVQQSIDHIRRVVSDVYLLWPLFITGSECVSEEHRNLIRHRCRSIQSDSGFNNNSSTLDLLERTWQEKDASDHNALAEEVKIQGPFKWRKNMAAGDEEYIVL